MFHPENSVLVMIEYFFLQGTRDSHFIQFEFSDFSISGLPLDKTKTKWLRTKNGYTVQGSSIRSFPSGSSVLDTFSKKASLDFSFENVKTPKTDSGINNICLDIFLPMPIRNTEGKVTLSLPNGLPVSRPVNSADTNGILSLVLPVGSLPEGFFGENSLALSLDIDGSLPAGSLPIVIFPVTLTPGNFLTFNPADITSAAPLKISATDPYTLDVDVELKGGISKNNHLYRNELYRPLKNPPVNLENKRIEVTIIPRTMTLDSWQTPYRARVGLVDINGQKLLGPNISLSEGVPELAHVDVTTKVPQPKGLAFPNFDPKRIKAVLLDFEEVTAIDTAAFACLVDVIRDHSKDLAGIGIINIHDKGESLLEVSEGRSNEIKEKVNKLPPGEIISVYII
jgi:hypothetical protein